MVKVVYEPFTEVVIKEYTHYEKIDDLIYPFAQARASGAPAALVWANGVVLIYTALEPDTDELMEEFLKGRIYWANVSFALMPEYRRVLRTEEKAEVPIINADSNIIIREVAGWLKETKVSTLKQS